MMLIFKNKYIRYGFNIKVISERCDRYLHRHLHTVIYCLNSAVLHDKEAFIETLEVMQGLLDLVEKKN